MRGIRRVQHSPDIAHNIFMTLYELQDCHPGMPMVNFFHLKIANPLAGAAAGAEETDDLDPPQRSNV